MPVQSDPLSQPKTTRLNKYLALALGTSRRQADELISSGAVTVNQQLATLGGRVQPTDSILVHGKPITTQVRYRYILFHKPVGYVCSRRQQGDTPTIYSLLPQSFYALKPVGRLDKDSSGLLLLSNDGDFAQRMTHPKYAKTKLYQVRLNKPLEPLHQQMIQQGITLEDGTSHMQLEHQDDDRINWQVVMHEGRNRQIRRTFQSLGYTVTKLHRTQFDNYSLGDIKPGKYLVTDMH